MAEIGVEGRVTKVGDLGHLYLVYTDDGGVEFVMRSGPEHKVFPNYGRIVVEVGVPLQQSEDGRIVDDV